MNLLGYEAGNVGNHEFNYGLEYLQTCLRGAQFPYINANIYVVGENEQNYFTPSGKLKESDAHRILQMSFEGELMDMQRSYLVVTNNYRAFSSTLVNPGGERIVLASPDENRHVLTEYVRHMKTLMPKADGHWSFVLC